MGGRERAVGGAVGEKRRRERPYLHLTIAPTHPAAPQEAGFRLGSPEQSLS